MARKHKITRTSGRRVLLVDDDRDYLDVTRRLLEGEGHAVTTAAAGREALDILRGQRFDVLLLDYFMPGMTGEEVVGELRRFDRTTQVVLQTGYASEQPARTMLRRLDIQGYYDKGEGPEKLLLWTDAALKSAEALQRLDRSRTGLRYILDVTPDLYKRQPVVDLLQGILSQVAGLIGVADTFIAALPETPLAASLETTEERGSRPPPPLDDPTDDDHLDSDVTASLPGARAILDAHPGELQIRASTGRFEGAELVADRFHPQEQQRILDALADGRIQVLETATVVPLRVGKLSLGVIYLERAVRSGDDLELLELFSSQATVAIQNMQLYEMAALDPLTGAHARRFFEQWLRREVRTAYRSLHPVSLLMVDMDNMKAINDSAGHLIGDQALTALGKVLREATRDNDVVGRFGGDEFAVLLPQTDLEGGRLVAERILEMLQDTAVPGPEGAIGLRCSLGLAELPAPDRGIAPSPAELADHGSAPDDDAPVSSHPLTASYFSKVAEALMAGADGALYAAKAAGRGRLMVGDLVSWRRPASMPPAAMAPGDEADAAS